MLSVCFIFKKWSKTEIEREIIVIDRGRVFELKEVIRDLFTSHRYHL